MSLAKHASDFAKSQGYIEEDEPVYMNEDNEAAIHLANRGKSNSDRTKHISLRYYFIKQFLDDGSFVLSHCQTNDMIADILTKPLQTEQFFKLRKVLLGYA